MKTRFQKASSEGVFSFSKVQILAAERGLLIFKCLIKRDSTWLLIHHFCFVFSTLSKNFLKVFCIFEVVSLRSFLLKFQAAPIISFLKLKFSALKSSSVEEMVSWIQSILTPHLLAFSPSKQHKVPTIANAWYFVVNQPN